jgi:hypothetical protein
MPPEQQVHQQTWGVEARKTGLGCALMLIRIADASTVKAAIMKVYP